MKEDENERTTTRWNGTECGRDDTLLLLLSYKHLYPFSLSSFLVDTRLQCHLVASGGFGGPDHVLLVDVWLRRDPLLECSYLVGISYVSIMACFVPVFGILWPDRCVAAALNSLLGLDPFPFHWCFGACVYDCVNIDIVTCHRLLLVMCTG